MALYRREGGAGFDLAIALSQVGTAAYIQKDDQGSRAYYDEGAALCRELGDLWALAINLKGLGLVAFRQGDLERATAHLKESIAVQRDIGENWFVSLAVEGLCRVLTAQGQHTRAARLMGAGEALREAVGASVLPFYVDDHDRARATLQAALGPETFNVLSSEGRAMTRDRAIAYALAEVDGPGGDSDG